MFETVFLGNTIREYVIALAVIALSIGFGHLFSLVVIKTIKKLAAKTKNTIDDIIVQTIEKPLVFAIFILGLYLAHYYIDFSQRGFQIYSNIMEILIVLDVIWILIKLVDASIEHYFKPLVEKSESKLDDQVLPFVRTFVKVIIIIIAAIFLIKRFGYDVTSLIAGLGIGGLAFALAAQPLLSNLFGGIAIIADKPFHINDRIKVDNKFEGYVKEIGMRSTTIKTPNDTYLTIPNAIIASTAVENLTRSTSVRVVFELNLSYKNSNKKIQEAIDIIKKILDENKNVEHDIAELAPFVGFSMYKESALLISAGYSIKFSNLITRTKTEINLAIKEAFEKSGIEFAYPTQTVYVKKE